jgi:hypothetical protein
MTIHVRHRPRKRAIQYSEALVIEPKGCGVLDTPLGSRHKCNTC